MKGCSFCAIRDGRVYAHKLWENRKFLAFLDINPVNPGHTLLIPKKHVEYVFDMDNELYSGIFKVAKSLSTPIAKAIRSKRIGIAIEGFAVPHVHIHMVPVKRCNELDPNRAKKATMKELDQVARRIRKEIKKTRVG